MQRLSLLALLFTLATCSKPLPELEGIDRQAWIDDKNGCGGKRAVMESAVNTEMEKLKGLSELDVVELLGKPDEHELYKRNQKFYSYFVTAGPDCDGHGEESRRLVIRFNAMGYAQLVSISSAGQ